MKGEEAKREKIVLHLFASSPFNLFPYLKFARGWSVMLLMTILGSGLVEPSRVGRISPSGLGTELIISVANARIMPGRGQ